MIRFRSAIPLVVALGLVAACSGGGNDTAPTSAPSTTAAPPTTGATTTTTIAPTTTTIAPTTAPDTVVDTLPEPEPVPPPDLSLPTKAIGTISLPKLGVTEPLLSGVTMPTLDKGPGHWPGTALPGRLGNVVVAGHRVSHSRPFYDLAKL